MTKAVKVPKAAKEMKAPKGPRPVSVRVTEINLRKAAARLLKSPLVSPEIFYIQRNLGASASQDVLDAQVLAVRAMPWSSIVIPD